MCAPQNPCDCRLEKDSADNEGSPAPPAAIEPLAVENPGIAQVKIESGDPAFTGAVQTALQKWRFAPSAAGQTLTATFTFALAGNPTEHISTTVSGASPLNLVISASPVRITTKDTHRLHDELCESFVQP